MSTIDEQIRDADENIVRNIAVLNDKRDLLSQNILAQLRNLVEGLTVLAHARDGSRTFRQSDVGEALDMVRADARLNVLSRFHHRLQGSASHYTLAGDPSERLMLKYYEYLVRVRDVAEKSSSGRSGSYASGSTPWWSGMAPRQHSYARLPWLR